MTHVELDLGPQYSGDDSFTRRMRRHQSWYRAAVLGVPCGVGPRAGAKSRYGNMLDAAAAARGLNFLTPEIHRVARARIAERSGAVEPFRLQHNMLSSMPMCFNLFGPLVVDRDLATRLWRGLLGAEVAEVTRVVLEYAPTPADEYLADRTAFDAFVEYRRPDGALCFSGIETKLTEPFSREHYPRERPGYRRWLELPAIPWHREGLSQVDRREHNQLWRDHLLAFAVAARAGSPYASGRLLLVRHDEDVRCAELVERYRSLLTGRDDTFRELPLSQVVDAWEPVLAVARDERRAAWLREFRRRYLELAASETVAAPSGVSTFA